MEHGGAGVDGVGGERGILREKCCQEAAVAVAEDEGASAAGELGEKVEAAAFEGEAQGEVFEPAVRAGDSVEVGVRRCQLCVLRCQK